MRRMMNQDTLASLVRTQVISNWTRVVTNQKRKMRKRLRQRQKYMNMK